MYHLGFSPAGLACDEPPCPQPEFRPCPIRLRQRPYTMQDHENLGKNGIDFRRRRGTLIYTAERGRESQHL